MKNTLADFSTSVSDLKQRNRNDEEIEQNHFGDFLMIQEPSEWVAYGEHYKVWLSHPDNIQQGQPVWQIEYAGKKNGYTWKVIAEGNN